ncbi:uncharacterized protein LOC113798806 isoform X1 [Dermatophagoides pteronyssinus]|uniref:uncharacterized protein LOC113798806 isoform X1 n=2 Tax=Dermatophagoides pteronyssinus TaxID=6956 RepID=UPI003F673E21
MINQENNHRQSTNPCQTSLLTTIFQTIRGRTINLFRQYWPLLDNKMKIKKTNNNNNQQSNSVQPMKTKSIIKRPTIESNRIQPTTSPTLIDSKQAKKLSPPSSILMINNDENFNQAPLDTNQMLIKSDSYAILCDINCHNWIIAFINWSIIYPRFILPTNQYFQFASVHDVSNLGNYFDNDNQFCLRLCCCCGGLCSYHHHQQQQYRKQQNRQQKQQQQQQQSSSTKNYHHQQQLSMTTIQINQRQNFQSINNDNNNNDANQQPLSVINSPINENPEIMMITTKTPSIKSLNLDSDSKQQRRTLNDELLNKNHKCANNDDCQTEITPDFSDVAYYPSILNTNQTDHNENINRKSEMINNQMDDQKIYSQNKQLPNKQIPFNKDDNDHRSTSSQSILSANSICCHVQHWKFYLIITLFIFISLRYLIHLVIIIFGNDNQEKNMIHFDYGYCPLIVAMLESLTTMLTIMIVYCRRTPIEELIIIKSSFFRPLCPWQRTYFIRMITILYLILSMIFFILTFCSWFPQITGIDSEWHHFRRSDSNIFTKYIWQQQQPITATTTTMSISMSRPPSTLDNNNNNQHSTTIHNQRSKRNSSEFQTISTINIDNITPFLDDNIDNTDDDDDDDDSVDYNSNVMIENNLTNTSSLINKTTTQRLPRYSSLPVNMFTTTPITTPSSIDHSTKSISSSNQKNKWWQIIEIWHLFFYFDFISNILCKYSLLLIKTLHLSVTILIILKCWQLYNEIRRLKYYFKNNNIDHFQRRQTNDTTTTTTSSSLDIIKSNESIIIIDNHNSRFGQRSRRRRHHHHQRQSEMERLTILTRILCKNIRYYHNVFGHLLLIWLLLTIFTLIAIWEFYKCSDQQNRLQKSIINNESNQQFHDWLIPYSMLIYHSIDLAIMFIFYLIIRILRYQCLWLIN